MNTKTLERLIHEYTNLQEVDDLLYSATRLMHNECYEAVQNRINEARQLLSQLLQEYSSSVRDNAMVGAGDKGFACYPIIDGCSRDAIAYGNEEKCRRAGRAYEKAHPGSSFIILSF